MSIIIFLFIPACWALTARLLGLAISLSLPAGRGKRADDLLRRWGVWGFPAVYLVLVFLGASGSAGSGVRLFGSEELFELLCLAWLFVPILGAYLVLVVVIRDMARGLRSWRS